MLRVGEVVEHIWQIGTSGQDLSGSITAALARYPSGTSEVSATESVAIAKISGAGAYRITYTPENAQTYKLSLSESTLPAETSYEDSISDAADTATADNCYCSVANVEGRAQIGSFTVSTKPSLVQVTTFMEDRAGEIYAILAATLGDKAPGPTGYDLGIDETRDTGRALSQQLRGANSMAAAADALSAAGAGDEPTRSARAENLLSDYQVALERAMKMAEVYLEEVTDTRSGATARSRGNVSTRSRTVRPEQGHVFDSETQW